MDACVKSKRAGESGDVVIGADSYVNSGTVIYTGHGVSIGKGVLIAANCTLAPGNHQFARGDIAIAKQGFQPSRGGILIEDDVWIGANCVILDGAILRKGSVVGAGTLVRGELAANTVYAGNPLREIGKRD